MKYYVDSLLQYILSQAKNTKRHDERSRLTFMLPGMDEKIVLYFSSRLTESCIKEDFHLILKIAKSLIESSDTTPEWSSAGKEEARNNNWYAERANLTYYRNQNVETDKTCLIVLIGADGVTDSASLADFHFCDVNFMWNCVLKGSFIEWIKEKLIESGISDYTERELKSVDEIVSSVLSCGFSDIIGISNWLDSINLTTAGNIEDVKKIFLSSTSFFGLPSMPRLIRLPRSQQKKIKDYFFTAHEFFSYTYFIDDTTRENAEKSVTDLLGILKEREELPEDIITIDEEDFYPAYSNTREFLTGLLEYITHESSEEKERLLKCDFITICKDILKFKIPKVPVKKQSVKKLSGDPLPVFLTAIYNTLNEFFKQQREKKDIIIESISLSGKIFRHDLEDPDDDDQNIADMNEYAREYLKRLIGGIDEVLKDYIDLQNINQSGIAIQSKLLHSDLACKKTRAQAAFEFEVTLSCSNGKSFSKSFAWKLPEHHIYRLSSELLKKTHELMEEPILPVFHLPYYEEIMQASSDEDARRILLYSLQEGSDEERFITNLLGGEWKNYLHDSLGRELKLLSQKYYEFINTAVSEGIFTVLFSQKDKWDELRKQISSTYEKALSFNDLNDSLFIGMLLRMFLCIQRYPEQQKEAWHAEYYEPSGIITILHPALIEMLEAQTVYLLDCFNYYVNKAFQTLQIEEYINDKEIKKLFNHRIWDTYIEFAEIQLPLCGLLHNAQRTLSTKVEGQSLLHRIGSIPYSNTPLLTRFLKQDESIEEDSLSDTELFKMNSDANLLKKVLLEYFQLHSHAYDGISLAIFRNKDIQPIIAAVNDFLKDLGTPKNERHYILNENRKRKYTVKITFFSEMDDEINILSLIRQWQDRWVSAETESRKYGHYKYCLLSVSHRIIDTSTEEGLKNFKKIIDGEFDSNIAVFYNFIGVGSDEADDFESVDEFDITQFSRKFPVLEKICCSVRNPMSKMRRSRIISNRQFKLSSYHSNLMCFIKNKGKKDKDCVVIGTGDFSPWSPIIDSIHKKAEWVVCIDPNIDEQLIYQDNTREIIGFGSGVGAHGENNYTISTELFSFREIIESLTEQLLAIYSPGTGWDRDTCEKISQSLIHTTSQLSGLSIVKATGIEDNYIHDFLAYTLTRKLIKQEANVLCDTMISFDAYRHWFAFSNEPGERPDLLHIKIDVDSQKLLNIHMNIIECKMIENDHQAIKKAARQVQNGLKVLTTAFTPANEKDVRPDQRYWWMQLHRLIASKIYIKQTEYTNILNALEQLSEGRFEITWSATILSFQRNKSPEIKLRKILETHINSESFDIKIYEIGGEVVKHLCIGENPPLFPPAEKDIETENSDKQHINIESFINDEEDFQKTQVVAPETEDDDIEDEDSVWDEYKKSEWEEDKVKFIQDNKKTTDEDSSNKTIDGNNIISPQKTSEDINSAKPPYTRIFLGKDMNDKPVYWEFGHPDLSNRHLLIFGASGQGKTYAIQCILYELAKFRQPSLIIDYTNGFLPNQLEKYTIEHLNPQQHVVKNNPLPINPFKPQQNDIGGILLTENANDVASRITSIFCKVYNIGEQQASVLRSAIAEGINTFSSSMDMKKMLEIIDKMREDKLKKTWAQSLFNKLEPFILEEPFASEMEGMNWKDLFSCKDSLCNIFQLAGMAYYSQYIVTEFILWDLYWYFQTEGKKDSPKVIVLDEVQNLDHREESPLSKYLREGRKFGVSLILATQIMSDMKKDERDRMFNAEHKLFFRPTDTELKAFAEIAALATHGKVNEWKYKLARLQKGECYSIGQVLTEHGLVKRAYKIRITPLEDRA